MVTKNWIKLSGAKTPLVGSALALLMLAGTAASSMAAPASVEAAADTTVAQSAGDYCQQLEQAAYDAYDQWEFWGNDVDYYRFVYYVQLGEQYCGW